MKLTFVYNVKLSKTQEKIINEIKWHSSKIYNILNYAVREGKEKIETKGNLNVEGSKIYKKYKEENWHGKYLHSHTLLEMILNYIRDYKSYIALKNMY